MPTEVTGFAVSAFSKALLRDLGDESKISLFRVTSVQRTVPNQARVLVQKHIISAKPFHYKNPDVTKLISSTKLEYDDPNGKHRGDSNWAIDRLAEGILSLKGGPQTASRHIVTTPFIEVFDIGLSDLSSVQTNALLVACRQRYPFPICRLGLPEKMHPDPDRGREYLSQHERKLQLEMVGPREFKDEDCFHFEVLVPVMTEGSQYMNFA